MHSRDMELMHLHPEVREPARKVLADLSADGIPFRLFEGFRSPQRQQHLWEQGRSRPGAIVTKARPWSSYHQYGLAVDLVLHEHNNWSWDDKGPKRSWWTRMQEIGRNNGLEPLSWELPHLQLRATSIDELYVGRFPAGGDDSWAQNLESAIIGWSNGSPAAPPLPGGLPERPPLVPDVPGEPVPANAAIAGSGGWHRKHGGQEWKYDHTGVYTRGDSKPMRTPGEPLTCRTVWNLFREPLLATSQRYEIPVAILMMTIATETGAYRKFGFSGPVTFRWEPHVIVKDVSPARPGDYSAGPMQTLATTARWVIREQQLNYDPFAVAPAYEIRPAPPAQHPLYDGAINIDIGGAEIKQRRKLTGDDPILVAAAFNAGGLYKTTANPWHLRSHGDHLDRAAKYYGDACAVLAEVG